jgi:phosphatidylglycerol:prolipoprotein diacylglycerol transferase
VYPRLLDLGPLSVYSYGLLLAAAYLAGLQLAIVRARRLGLDSGRVMDLGIWVIVSALVGAKLLLVAVDFEYFLRNPADLFSIVRSGGVFYGGLILAVLVGVWYIRRHRLPLWPVCDAFAPGIALGHVIGRVGCLLGGCCYGMPTRVAWAVTFSDPFAAENAGTPLGVPLHPTQLYEAGAELLILAALLALERRGRPFAGRTFWGYMLAYAVSRFVIEFFRGDPRGAVLSLPTSQFIALALVPLSVAMLVYLARRPEPAPAEPARRGRSHR